MSRSPENPRLFPFEKIAFRLFSLVLAGALFAAAVLALSPVELNRAGIEAAEAGNWVAAIEHFDNACRSAPVDPTIRKNLQRACLSHASMLADAGRHEDAEKWIAAARKAMGSGEVDRAHSVIRSNRAVILAERGEWTGAIELAESAIRLDATNSVAARNLGTIYHNYAHTLAPTRRIVYLQKALAYLPTSPAVLRALGDEAYERSDLSTALDRYRAALEHDPRNVPLLKRVEAVAAEAASEQGYRQTKRRRFLVKYDGVEKQRIAESVLDVLEHACRDLDSRFGFRPEQTVTVIVHTGEDFRNVSATPDWAAGSFDGKIRVREGDALADPGQLKDLLYHEYVHALVHERAGPAVPVWWNEGLAQYLEPSARTHSQRIRRILQRRRGTAAWIPISGLDRAFRSHDVEIARQAYYESRSAIEFLVARRGDSAVTRILDATAAGATFADALRDAYGAGIGEFERDWLASLE